MFLLAREQLQVKLLTRQSSVQFCALNKPNSYKDKGDRDESV